MLNFPKNIFFYFLKKVLNKMKNTNLDGPMCWYRIIIVLFV